MKFTSYIWDFDGTLFDSYPYITAAFEEIMERDHIPYDRDTLTACLRVNFHEARDHFGMTPQQYQDTLALQRDMTRKPEIVPYPGTCAVLRAITEAGGQNFLYTHRDGAARTFLRLDRKSVV